MTKLNFAEVLKYTDEQLEEITAKEIQSMQYAISYYDSSVAHSGEPKNVDRAVREWEVQKALKARLKEIEAQAQPKPRSRYVGTAPLCDCGHYAIHPMTASLGSSCPDCYDKMS